MGRNVSIHVLHFPAVFFPHPAPTTTTTDSEKRELKGKLYNVYIGCWVEEENPKYSERMEEKRDERVKKKPAAGADQIRKLSTSGSRNTICLYVR